MFSLFRWIGTYIDFIREEFIDRHGEEMLSFCLRCCGFVAAAVLVVKFVIVQSARMKTT